MGGYSLSNPVYMTGSYTQHCQHHTCEHTTRQQVRIGCATRCKGMLKHCSRGGSDRSRAEHVYVQGWNAAGAGKWETEQSCEALQEHFDKKVPGAILIHLSFREGS